MKKQRKKFFGAAYLALVTAMTLVAASIPTPNVGATTNYGGATVTVTVVNENYPSVSIIEPSDGSKIEQSDFDLKFDYTNSDSIRITIKNTDSDNEWYINITPTDPRGGSMTQPIDLNNYEGEGNYVIKLVATGNNQYAEDSIALTYEEPAIDPTIAILSPIDGDKVEENTIDINYEYTNANSIDFVITNNKSGNSWTKTVTLSNPAYGNPTQKIDLDEYEGEGEYTIKLIAHGDKTNSEDSIAIDYAKVPVYEPTINILEPADSSKVEDGNVTVRFNYGHINNATVVLTSDTTGKSWSIDVDIIDPISGTIRLPINLDDYEGEGDYTITVYAYGDTKNAEDSVSFTFAIPEPDLPDIPNTGLFAQELTFSQMDYIITGVLAFFVVSVGALIYLKKARR